jgi:hypothetical protein
MLELTDLRQVDQPRGGVDVAGPRQPGITIV